MNIDDESTRRVLAVTVFAGLIGMMSAVWRGIVVERHGSWWGFARGATASIAVAVLIGWWLDTSGLPTTMQAAIIGAAAFVAEDILIGAAALASMFRTDPLRMLKDLWEAWRGGRGK